MVLSDHADSDQSPERLAAALPVPLADFHRLLARAYAMGEMGLTAAACLRNAVELASDRPAEAAALLDAARAYLDARRLPRATARRPRGRPTLTEDPYERYRATERAYLDWKRAYPRGTQTQYVGTRHLSVSTLQRHLRTARAHPVETSE